jgi:hypothetical protein
MSAPLKRNEFLARRTFRYQAASRHGLCAAHKKVKHYFAVQQFSACGEFGGDWASNGESELNVANAKGCLSFLSYL